MCSRWWSCDWRWTAVQGRIGQHCLTGHKIHRSLWSCGKHGTPLQHDCSAHSRRWNTNTVALGKWLAADQLKNGPLQTYYHNYVSSFCLKLIRTSRHLSMAVWTYFLCLISNHSFTLKTLTFIFLFCLSLTVRLFYLSVSVCLWKKDKHAVTAWTTNISKIFVVVLETVKKWVA